MQYNLKNLFEKITNFLKKKNLILIKFDDFLLEPHKILNDISIKFNLKLSKSVN